LRGLGVIKISVDKEWEFLKFPFFIYSLIDLLGFLRSRIVNAKAAFIEMVLPF
jgi:hypothetical protein